MRERSASEAHERGRRANGCGRRESGRGDDRGRSGNGRAFILILEQVVRDGVVVCEKVGGVAWRRASVVRQFDTTSQGSD